MSGGVISCEHLLGAAWPSCWASDWPCLTGAGQVEVPRPHLPGEQLHFFPEDHLSRRQCRCKVVRARLCHTICHTILASNPSVSPAPELYGTCHKHKAALQTALTRSISVCFKVLVCLSFDCDSFVCQTGFSLLPTSNTSELQGSYCTEMLCKSSVQAGHTCAPT